MASYEQITLTQVTKTALGTSITPTVNRGMPIPVTAIAVDSPGVRVVEEGAVIFNYDTEFRVRRFDAIEGVDSSWELVARGKKWKILRVRPFSMNGVRDNWFGIQAKAGK